MEVNLRKGIAALLSLILTLTLLVSVSGFAFAKESDPASKADPRLLQMAAENPDAIFMVIVQKDAKNKDLKNMEVENEVRNGGGKIKKQLGMIVSFAAEMTGAEIGKLAKNPKVRWISVDAPMANTAAPGMDAVRDEFSSIVYAGNNGTKNWSTDWMETGETDGVSSGYLRVVADSINGTPYTCMRLGAYTSISKTISNYSIKREANLAGASSAWLTYNYRRFGTASNSTVVVTVQVSKDGGTNWSNLTQHNLNTTDSAVGEKSLDISAFASANTVIRFLMSGTFPAVSYTYLFVDNIQIQYAFTSAYLSSIKADQLTTNASGIGVAVIDSGVNANHPDLMSNGQSMVKASAQFGSHTTANDDFGHGTHVAGIITGNGTSSGGLFKGVTENANLINVKTNDAAGMTYESDVIAALEWVYNNKAAYNIRVVNLSMNSTVDQSYHTSPLSAAVEILWFNQIVVVVSAGNNGTADGASKVYPPANDPFVITVGATEDWGTSSLSDDTMAVFSAYGTTGDGFSKPDLVAPGRNIIAALSGTGSTIYQNFPLHRVSNSRYFRMSGTSMSAPMVTGTIAALLKDEPNLTPDQVKYRLMSTANKSWTNYSAAKAGAGYLDVDAAVKGSTTQSANTGIAVSQMLNSGSEPISSSVGWNSVGWNSVGWNSVGWNSVGWNSVGWNSVGWNSVGWNSVGWNSVGWNSVGWNTSNWDK